MHENNVLLLFFKKLFLILAHQNNSKKQKKNNFKQNFLSRNHETRFQPQKQIAPRTLRIKINLQQSLET